MTDACLTLLLMLLLTIQFSDIPEALDTWLNRVWPESAPSQKGSSSSTNEHELPT